MHSDITKCDFLKTLYLFFFLFLCISVCFSFETQLNNEIQYPNTVLGFEENKGQFADEKGNLVPDILFRAALPQADVYITTKGMAYCFIRHSKERTPRPDTLITRERFFKKHKIEWSLTKVEFENASIDKKNIVAEFPIQGFNNYYFAHCPNGIENVRSYKKITVKNIYPGIDWVIYFDENEKLKYDFVLNAGANYNQIKLKYITPSEIKLNENASAITIKSKLGKLEEGELYTYEKISNKPIKSSYKILSKHNSVANNIYELGFDLDKYDKSSTVIIDPPLVWATYYGGSAYDGPRGMETDTAGNLYITGYSNGAMPVFNPPGSTDFFQGAMMGVGNIMILKFDKYGVRKWATYYGGSEDDWGRAITTDNAGNIYVTGEAASLDLPLQNLSGAYNQAINNGGYDAFVLKFGSLGNRIWATYYGGSSDDFGTSIAYDNINQQLYFVGSTNSYDLPFQHLSVAYNQTYNAMADAFVAKFDQNMNCTWATFFGGNDGDSFTDVEVDKFGNAYLIGNTASANFPVQNLLGGFNQSVRSGSLTNSDLVIIKCSSAGILLWSTYYGGSASEGASSLTTDNCGNIYITGSTASLDFPTRTIGSGCFIQPLLNAGIKDDAFVIKFSANGILMWSTYFGGSDYDHALSIVANKYGDLYITGQTWSTDFPMQQPLTGYYQTSSGGSVDIFVSHFDNLSGALKWSTYYGGDDVDFGAAISLDKNDRSVYITGELISFNGINTVNYGGNAYYQSGNAGIPVWGPDDGYILKFKADTLLFLATEVNVINISCHNLANGLANVNPYNGSAPYSFLWSNSATTQSTSLLSSGLYTVTVVDAYCNNHTDSVVVTQPPALTNTITPSLVLCPYQYTTLNSTGIGGIPPYNYSWSTGVAGASINVFPNVTTTYHATVTDSNGCTYTEQVTVVVDMECAGDVFLPNAFSPNSDGENDVLKIFGGQKIEYFYLEIYNRWGEKIFETSDAAFKWDGTFKQRELNTDTFMYVLEAQLPGYNSFKKTGTIHLIR